MRSVSYIICATFSVAAIARAQTPATLVSFNGNNGFEPLAGISMGADGILYGTTFHGGANGAGTIFKIDPITHALTTLADFNGANGGQPQANVIVDGNGNLLGTTRIGGNSAGYGTVFSVNPNTHAITTTASFTSTNGAFPDAGVVRDTGGNLYGTTPFGGAYDWGTVFEISASDHSITTLKSFPVGQTCVAGLLSDGNGNLIGTMVGGGLNGAGAIFKIDAVTHTFSTIASFAASDGSPPLSCSPKMSPLDDIESRPGKGRDEEAIFRGTDCGHPA